jgi:DNA-binding CsgD family transcriptional regulator
MASTRALALAHSNDTAGAAELARIALEISTDAQAQTAAHAALTIVALRIGRREEATLAALENVLLERENYDGLVHAYRSYPALLTAIASRGRIPEQRLFTLVIDARDTRLAKAAGLKLPARTPAGSQLSRREEEVFELLRSGKTNREIAQTLFISEATAKVHVRHIFDKLGARSRTEAVARYQET